MRRSLLLGICLVIGCGDAATTPVSDAGGAGDASAGEPCLRRVLESEVTNARDLGGWPVADGVVSCGQLYRGGALTLSDTGCAAFAALGVRTIVDLREVGEQTLAPPPACAVAAATHIAAPLPKLLPDTPEHYVALLDETASVQALFTVLSSTASYPVYVHCVIGRDRASFATALVLLVVGASRDTVMEEFLLSSEAGIAVKAECLAALLDELEARGGIDAYLDSVGVDSQAREAVRQRLVAEASSP